MRRLWKPLAYVAVAIYFIADVLFLSSVQPISRWCATNFPMPKVRAWIRSLPPYPSLALFSVPVIVLEPVKMVAAYMAATGQVIWAAITFIVGELLKLVLVERLFALTKTKLMKIPAFAWTYNQYERAKAWVMETGRGRPLDHWACRFAITAGNGSVWRLPISLLGSGSELHQEAAA